jgi:hypothetical protein
VAPATRSAHPIFHSHSRIVFIDLIALSRQHPRMIVSHGHSITARRKLHWGRILGGAVLLELLLFVVLVPIGLTFGMPGAANAKDLRIFFIAVPVGCFAGGAAIAAWVLRRVESRRTLHGALLGVAATLVYLAICALQPGGISAVIAGYGPLLFWASQALRISGCVLGGRSRRSQPGAA